MVVLTAAVVTTTLFLLYLPTMSSSLSFLFFLFLSGAVEVFDAAEGVR